MDLLERESFLGTLAEYAAEARNGDGRLVLVSGESGIGKTALLEVFQRRSTGARWLWGACDGLLTPRPLGPLFDIGPQAGGELAELCRREAPRDRLFAAFQAELSQAAAFTVVVLEDLHWADEATIDLLSFVGRRLGRMPALLLATYRDNELGEDHPLRMVLGDLATQGAARRMRLPPLSEAAVRALVGQRGVDAAELYRVTGGNPFYVREILEAGWPSVPPTVRDAGRGPGWHGAVRLPGGRSRQRRLPGHRVDRLILPWVVGDLSASIEECLATGVLIADGTGLGYRPRAGADGRGGRDRAAPEGGADSSLLAELEARDDGDPALLAHHADGAGDERAVLRHAPEAAQRQAALGAHREAAAQYERALRNAQNAGEPLLAALQEGLADEYALLDRWEEVEQARRAALALRRELGDELSVGKNLRSLSTTLWRLCRGEEADRAAEEAATVLEALPPGEALASAYAGLACAYLKMGGTNEATLALLGKARDIAEQRGCLGVTCFALIVEGVGLVTA